MDSAGLKTVLPYASLSGAAVKSMMCANIHVMQELSQHMGKDGISGQLLQSRACCQQKGGVIAYLENTQLFPWHLPRDKLPQDHAEGENICCFGVRLQQSVHPGMRS